ncbi:MAG: enoyl-CoA hydratase/isomerase family protein [Chloroflexi bacterium]|nr:enoyl-CoA hydratase/isomerase family protein [Chloroflexota bacterium]MCH8816968.1 enoyl-CoA hydratase/isomerase family protein [Chloroflexota bacterium]
MPESRESQTAQARYENLLIDRVGTDGRVARVTLNRPEKLNALSQELLFEFSDALHELEADDDARVIIVKGAGRAFCAGYDITPPGGSGSDAVARRYRTADGNGRRLLMGIRTAMQQITDILMYFWNMAKVTIAQVHGYAIAGGCELAMMADLVTAADDAQLGHPGLRGMGTSRTGVIWPLVMGMRKAKELYLTGDPVTGVEAEEMGMINYAWPGDELDDRTIALADRIANMSADHLAILKLNMNRFYENMGIYSSVRSSTDLDAAGQFTDHSYAWQDTMREGGFRKAVAWRDGPYGDYSAKPR